MSCASCMSGNQTEFSAEMIIHFAGLKNVDKCGVLPFPNILVCLDCGLFSHAVPAPKLVLLSKSTSKSECSAGDAEPFEADGLESVRESVPADTAHS
jgi:hypothetical protein